MSIHSCYKVKRTMWYPNSLFFFHFWGPKTFATAFANQTPTFETKRTERSKIHIRGEQITFFLIRMWRAVLSSSLVRDFASTTRSFVCLRCSGTAPNSLGPKETEWLWGEEPKKELACRIHSEVAAIVVLLKVSLFLFFFFFVCSFISALIALSSLVPVETREAEFD